MLNTAATFAVCTMITLCTVAHPGWRLVIIALLATAAYHRGMQALTHAADARADKRRRARRSTATLLASMLLTSCSDEAPNTPAPAEIESIECSVRCRITTAGPSTLIVLTEE